ncbi:MAG: hypothetical protein AB2A00_28145 [Myxococcota bacterium]
MPVSALVITLSDDVDEREHALSVLGAHAGLVLGPEQAGRRVPAVLETATLGEGIRRLEEELPLVRGVRFIDVVSVDFSDVDPGSEAAPVRRRRRDREVDA